MRIIPAEPYRTRTLALSTGATLTERQLADYFLVSGGSFARRPQVEEELSVIFDLLEKVEAFVTRKRLEAAKEQNDEV